MKRSLLLLTCFIGGYTAQAQYCTPPPPNDIGLAGITSVQFGTLNNSSTDQAGYTYFSAVAAPDIAQGAQLFLTVDHTHNIQGIGFSDLLNVYTWIDWNNDGDFDDAGENVMALDGVVPGSSSQLVSVPAGATPGITRMRVYNDMLVVDGHIDPDPCGYLGSSNQTGQHGECEDYDINITTSTGISAIATGELTYNVRTVPDGIDVALNLPANMPVDITVLDLTGKTVAAKNYGTLPEGNQLVHLELAVNKAIYLVRIQAGERVFVTKWVKR